MSSKSLIKRDFVAGNLCWILALVLMPIFHSRADFEDFTLHDIGATGAIGSGTYDSQDKIYEISGAGAGVQSNQDALTYVYQIVGGDAEITVRVNQVTGSSSAMAGISVRAGLGSGSQAVSLTRNNQGTIVFSTRKNENGNALNAATLQDVNAKWLRLIKRGPNILGYISADGANWTLMGQEEIQLPSAFYVGQTISSGTTGVTATAILSRVSVVSHLPTSIPSLQIWLRADAGVLIQPLDFNWLDQSENHTNGVQYIAQYYPSWIDNQLNNKPVLRFDGGVDGSEADWLRAGGWYDSGNQVTIFTVCRLDNNGGYLSGGSPCGGIFVWGNDWAHGYGIRGYLGNTAAFFANSTFLTAPLVPNAYNVIWARFSYQPPTSSAQISVNGNGASGTPSAPISYNGGPFNIGGRGAGGNMYGMKGDVAEILMFKRALSDDEVRAVERYLYSRYKIGVPPALDVPNPTSASPSGIYSSGRMITFQPPGGVVYYYTLDGTEPTTASNFYSGPIFLNSTSVLKVKAFQAGFTPSSTLTFNYTIDPQADFNRNGLVSWYRADTGVEMSGSNVSKWKDQSADPADAIQNGSYGLPVVATMSGKPAIRFSPTGNQQLLIPGSPKFNVTNAVTMIAVAKRTSGTNLVNIMQRGGPNYYGLQFRDAATNAAFFVIPPSATHLATQGVGTNIPAVIEGIYNGSVLQTYVNGVKGVAVAGGSSLAGTTNPFYIGGVGAGYSLNGDIAELMIFNRALNEAERQEINSYLFARYTLGDPLPVLLTTDKPSGIYSGSFNIQVKAPSGGLVIRYTTDGSAPTTSSPIYTGGAISVNSSMTLKFRYFSNSSGSAIASSQILTLNYTIDPQADFNRNGLVSWYRADTGVEMSGSNVSKWKDQSTDPADAIQNGSYGLPTVGTMSGQPTVRFSPTGNQQLIIPSSPKFNVSNAVTLIAVAKRTSGTNLVTVIQRGGPNYYGLQFRDAASNAAFFVIPPSATYLTTQGVGTNVPAVIEGIYNGSSLQTYINGAKGTALAGGPALAATVNPIYVGGANAGYSLNGDIAELMIFNRPLSDVDRARIEMYLFARYSLGNPGLNVLPISGIYTSPINVTVDSPLQGLTVRYTTDGTDPSASSAIFPGSISVNTAQRFKFRLFNGTTASSKVVARNYVIDATAVFSRVGLVGWYRADAGITASGNLVSEWADMSGTDNDASQPVSGNRPSQIASVINNKPVIRFSSTGAKYLRVQNPNLSLNGVTVIAVARKTGSAVAESGVVHGFTGSAGFALTISGSAQATLYANTLSNKATAHLGALGNWAIISALCGSSGMHVYANGVLGGIGGQTSTYSGGITNVNVPMGIGATGAGSANLDGDIAEVLIFNRRLSVFERYRVEQYLENRYGIDIEPPVDDLGAIREGFNTTEIPPNDDLFSPLVSVGFPINLFGTTFSNCYVNNNGNLTFFNPLGAYTPNPLQNSGIPMIAPFWADVDTRPVGTLPVSYGQGVVDGRLAFGATYVEVGYYNKRIDKLNNFQVVLIDRSDIAVGDFDIEFNYGRVLWETGDASGGTNGYGGSSARVGITNGANSTLELENSGKPLKLLDSDPTNGLPNYFTGLIYLNKNSDIDGRYVFNFRSGQLLGALQVDAGPDQIGLPVQTSASLSGSASDPLGGTLSYEWTQLSAPPGVTVLFSNPTDLATSVTLPVSGSYRFQLRVISSGPSGTVSANDSVVVTRN